MILAGVTVNLIIAFVLFFVVIAGQGQVSRRAEHDGRSASQGTAPAAEAGFAPGDKIVAVNGHTIDGLGPT